MPKQFPQDYTPIEIQRFIDAAKEAAEVHLQPLRTEITSEIVTGGESELDGIASDGYGIYSRSIQERYIDINIRMDITGHNITQGRDGVIRVFRGSEPKD